MFLLINNNNMFRKLFKLSIIAIFVWLLKESVMPIYRRILCFIDWYNNLSDTKTFFFWFGVMIILTFLYVQIYNDDEGIHGGH